jgi:predicted RNA polymerase sigma factor
VQVDDALVIARQSYGRLLALLASRSGDLAGSEDALADAFEAALLTWPEKGVPNNPEAWLMAAAKNRQLDVWRSAAAQTSVELTDEVAETVFITDKDPDLIPDERLKLLFVCAHPAIDTALRAPLMLQTVLGLEADQIGNAFAVPATTMAQRLVRVKRKIKEAGIPFETPSLSDMPERLDSVLEAIFGAYSIGWIDTETPNSEDSNVAEESRYLANLIAQLMPDEPEVLGLAAYISLSSARRSARVGLDAVYVPLSEQDTSLWDHRRISWGERLLQRAQTSKRVGRFQLEAAIQSVHCNRMRTGATDWVSLALLYEGLIKLAPSLGAVVARAVAVGYAYSPSKGIAALDQLATDSAQNFQPYWAARAHLLWLDSRHGDAVLAIDKAIALEANHRSRQYLLKQKLRYES